MYFPQADKKATETDKTNTETDKKLLLGLL